MGIFLTSNEFSNENKHRLNITSIFKPKTQNVKEINLFMNVKEIAEVISEKLMDVVKQEIKAN